MCKVINFRTNATCPTRQAKGGPEYSFQQASCHEDLACWSSFCAVSVHTPTMHAFDKSSRSYVPHDHSVLCVFAGESDVLHSRS